MKGGLREQGGFTLLELLISLTLMGLLVTALFGGLRVGARVWEAGNERSQALAEIEAVRGLLRRELNQVYPLPLTDRRDRKRLAFEGKRNALSFAAPVPAHLAVGGFYLIELAVTGVGEEKNLVMSWRLYQPGEDAFEPAKEDNKSVLLEKIAGAAFAFFGKRQGQSRAAWFDQWDEEKTLPRLIRLEVEFPSGDRRVWSDLVVRLLVQTNAAPPYFAAPQEWD